MSTIGSDRTFNHIIWTPNKCYCDYRLQLTFDYQTIRNFIDKFSAF